MIVTTNIELIELAKCLLIPNFNCICKDEINAQIINPKNGMLLNSFLKTLLKQGLGHTSSNSLTNIYVNLNVCDKNVNCH